MGREWNTPRVVRNILIAVLVFFVATVIGYAFDAVKFPDTNIVIVYLVAVLIIVWITKSFILGLIVSVAGTFAFNYFFAAPRFTLEVNNSNYYITFISMILTALATSLLTTRARNEAQRAHEAEAETKAIYMLTNQLIDAEDMDEIVGISLNSICEGLHCDAGLLCFDENGMPEDTYVLKIFGIDNHVIRRETEEAAKIKYQIEHITGTYNNSGEFCDYPLYGGDRVLGIIRLKKEDTIKLSNLQRSLLHSMVDSIAIAMDRLLTAKQRMESLNEAARERYRANLIRSISHDIRTPLTGIIGTSAMLEDALKDDVYKRELAASITADAEWLHGLVENILNMTRLQDGTMKLKKEKVPVEEVIGGAIGHVFANNPTADIDVEIPDELIMIPMDPKLIEQVLVNLLGNAIKHSDEGSPILIKVYKEPENVVFHVIDSGEGVIEENLPHIFQSFYSVEKPEIKVDRGVGLGLSICETIINAHGGTITASNRTDRSGAIFTFKLPLEDQNE